MRHAATRLALAALVLLLGAGMSAAFFGKRPTTISFGYASHPLTPAMKRVVVNGLVMADDVIGSRNTTGEIPYKGPFSRTLEVEATWYDILNETAWRVALDIDAAELSTYGTAGTHAEVNLLLGPGADVRVTTPHPDRLRLIGTGRQDEITPEQDVPVIIADYCATALPLTDAIVAKLIDEAQHVSMDRPMENRENAIRHGRTSGSRCAGDSDTEDWRE